MADLKHLKAGDPIVIVHRHRGAYQTTVTKVGRVYLYVGGYAAHGFSREDGRAQGEAGAYYSFVRTVEEHARICEVEKARTELSCAGITLARSMGDDLVTKIRDVLRFAGITKP